MNNLAYAYNSSDDDYKRRYEVIDGVIVMMSPRPCVDHVIVSGNIYRIFANYLKGKRCIAFPDGADLYLDDENHFIPDGMIICNRNIIKRNYIKGAPDLVVEILSPITAKNDRGRKKEAYAKAGVKEYWIVDIKGKAIEVYLNHNGSLDIDEIYYDFTPEEIAENEALPDGDKDKMVIREDIKVSLYDDLFVHIKDVFDNLL